MRNTTPLRNYRHPTHTTYNGMVYSEQDKRDIVWLIDQGYPPLDVAVAFGVPVYRYVRRGVAVTSSRIYQNYEKWKTRFEREAMKASFKAVAE